jgi:hypothetical protein
LTLVEQLHEIHVTSLDGLGASYRITGYFTVRSDREKESRIDFNAVAFGGNYGGHNVNVQITESAVNELRQGDKFSEMDVDTLIVEVQRRMLNNEMIVEYDQLKPQTENGDFGKPPK